MANTDTKKARSFTGRRRSSAFAQDKFTLQIRYIRTSTSLLRVMDWNESEGIFGASKPAARHGHKRSNIQEVEKTSITEEGYVPVGPMTLGYRYLKNPLESVEVGAEWSRGVQF